MSRALSDDQVANELRKMTAFIHQEAMEKAKEIQIKADEEFAIEKSKLVREETAAIDSNFAKKHKQASMSQQITRSTLANKTRIKVLSRRQELLNDLFDQAKGKVGSYTEDKGSYQNICKDLILEGLYALNEKKVAVRARKPDYDLVKKAMTAAQQEYKKELGQDVELLLDEKHPQSDESSGGVSIVGGNGKIDINNTFEERLRLLETDALPMMRTRLFGENQNRRFFD